MANERVLVSPGVYDREIDGTFRVADPTGISTALISPREKGPAFEPTLLKDRDADEQYFGLPNSLGTDFGAYCAREYLGVESDPLIQVRLLGMSDTGVTPGYNVGTTYALLSSGSTVVALIQASGSTTVSLQGTLTSSADSLAIAITGQTSVTASLYRSSDKYISKVLNTDPALLHTKKHVLFAVYDYALANPAAGDAFAVSEFGVSGLASAWTDDFLTGASTTVISQPFDSTEYNLFGVGNRFAGDSANKEFKVSIASIKKSPNEGLQPYGSFNVLVRKYDDNDKSPVVLESFVNCSLDPDSPNYVCRKVGDMYKVWNKTTKKFDEFGEYENKSKYIYILPSADLTNGEVPDTALPWGFTGYNTFVSGVFGSKAPFPDMPMVQGPTYKGNYTSKIYWGTEVIKNSSGSINHGVLDRVKHIPAAVIAASGSTGQKFSLKWLSGATGVATGYATTTRLTATNLTELSTSLSYSVSSQVSPTDRLTVANIENTDLARFTFVMSDGFDAVDLTKRNPFDPADMASTTTYQTYAYRTALDMLENGDEIEISELTMPGVWHDNVVQYAVDMVEERGDVFYMADISGSTIDDAVDTLASNNWETNYAGVYYPWLVYKDPVYNKQVSVPPTTILPAVFAYSDKVSFPWYAVAGMNRAGLKKFNVVRAKDKLKKKERDRLYENRINPIGTFPGEGVVVWGQKTLQIAPSALDRINVRRMLLHTRKLIAKEALKIVFEPNVPAVWQSFENKITPKLEEIKQNYGLDQFSVVFDERTTTEDLIERNIMYGKLAVRPTRTAEIVFLDFFVTNNTAGFEL